MQYQISEETASQIVETVKSVCGYDVNFIDREGVILASTDSQRVGTYHAVGRRTALEGKTIEVTDSEAFAGSRPGINVPVFHNRNCAAVIGISGQPDQVRPYAELARRVTELLIREQEMNSAAQNRKEQRSYALSALLQKDIRDPEYLEELLTRFAVDPQQKKRIVLFRFRSNLDAREQELLEQHTLECINELEMPLYMHQYPGGMIGLLEVRQEKKARLRLERMAEAEQGKLQIGLGKAVPLDRLYRSEESARTALRAAVENGKAFAAYDDLTLELMFSSLDRERQTSFLSKTVAALGEDDLNLLSTYFSSNLSLSDTAKALYIHKNTVQYRLNRIGEQTHLNPRIFRDAVLLYLGVCLRRKNRTASTPKIR